MKIATFAKPQNVMHKLKMKRIIYLLLFLPTVLFAQTNGNFLSNFLLGSKLNQENVIDKFNHCDFSKIWLHTKNYQIVGIIGTDYERIKIKLLSVRKSKDNPNKYFVEGKSNVKGNICDFSGVIKLVKIKTTNKLHFGVDNEYKGKGIKSEGILIATYEFKEQKDQDHSGIFQGKLYTKWYVNAISQIKYDDIQFTSDGYMNNAFIGTWKSYSTNKVKICNWGDFRVPEVKPDFDIGAGDFSPSKKYYDYGWMNYQKAWLNGNKEAQKEELKKWWQ
jgi:hypothetical protein